MLGQRHGAMPLRRADQQGRRLTGDLPSRTPVIAQAGREHIWERVTSQWNTNGRPVHVLLGVSSQSTRGRTPRAHSGASNIVPVASLPSTIMSPVRIYQRIQVSVPSPQATRRRLATLHKLVLRRETSAPTCAKTLRLPGRRRNKIYITTSRRASERFAKDKARYKPSLTS